MASLRIAVVNALLLAISLLSNEALSQQVAVATPFHNHSGGFFEHFGVNFGFQKSSPNGWMFFNSGNSMSGMPPFGGFEPGSASSFGIGGRSGNSIWNLNLIGSQGYSQSSVSTTPMLTLPNGGFGFINNTVQRPFVVGYMPVINGEPQAHRINRRLQYDKAAQVIVSEGLREDKRDAAEFEVLRTKAKMNLAKSRPKADDPPLILGRSASG